MTSRFARRPEYDLRACAGCGDSCATQCWVDQTCGALCWMQPGWCPEETQDKRQLDFLDPAKGSERPQDARR